MNLDTIDIYDNQGNFIGRAVVNFDESDCPFFHLDTDRFSVGRACENFVNGVTYGSRDNITITHVNNPIIINRNIKYNEVRETIINELRKRGYQLWAE